MDDGDPTNAGLRAQLLGLRTNMRAFAVSALCVVAGVGLVFLAANVPALDEGTLRWTAVLTALGGSIMAVGALALVFELSTRRSVMQETLAAASLSDEIRRAGLSGIHSERKELDRQFAERIGSASNVDLMFISAAGWMETNEVALEAMLRAGGRVRLLIPDPDDTDLLGHLLSRFDYPDLEQLKLDVRRTLQIAQGIARRFPERVVRGRLVSGFAIRRLGVVPTYSLYKVDRFGVIRVHEVRKPRARVTPVLVFNASGVFDSFAMEDFEYLFAPARRHEAETVT